ncbi:MAG: phage antirepressor KilAC domain-containing protein [Blastocatellia bacterium]
MNSPLSLQQHNGKACVSAREMYEALGLDKSNWMRWYVKNIQDNPFALAGVDYEGFVIKTNGNESRDFALSLDFAKRLAMMVRTSKGEEVRSYFLECERLAQEQATIKQFNLPMDYLSALKRLVAAEESRMALQATITAQAALLEDAQPKVEFYNAVIASNDAISIRAASKLLNIEGLGQIKLFSFLRQQKVLMTNNQPYQEYIDRGWFRMVESQWREPDGTAHIYLQTLVYQKGIDGIRRLWEKHNSKNIVTLPKYAIGAPSTSLNQ